MVQHRSDVLCLPIHRCDRLYVFPKPIDMQLTGENKYSIHKNVWKDGQPTKWEIYFEDISYASGIKFCQNNEFANVRFSMTRNRSTIVEQPVMKTTSIAKHNPNGDPSWGL